MSAAESRIYEFEEFRLDAVHSMLYRGGQELRLPPKAVETLAVLVARQREILSKDELMSLVWPNSIVEESNLSQYLHLLRKTLGVKRNGQPFIETLRRRGYRFVAEVSSGNELRNADAAEISRSSVDPAASNDLIGRENELAAIVALLKGGTRLVTLTGVGGVGKTTLARAVTAALRNENAGRIFFVELSAVTNPEVIVSLIASAVGVREATNRQIIETLKEDFRINETTLVLDNFEQVVSAAPHIAGLLSAAPTLKILITSRVLLNVRAEVEYAVPPLGFPEKSAASNGVSGREREQESDRLESLSSSPAVQLFVVRARQAKPQFALTHGNAAGVVEICSRLEGLPLAIELAAARIRLMSPASILARLQSQLKLLTGGPRDMPARQQTMRAAVEWSYELLNENEKRLFQRLSVFKGGFTIDAAGAVCGSNDLDYRVLDGFTALAAHNLLVSRDNGDGDLRFQMLEVIREYSNELLAQSDESEFIRRRHAEYFTALGEEAEPQIQAAQSAEWLNRLEIEHDNLRAALRWSHSHEAALGQRLAGAVWRFWWLHGHIREGCEQLESLLSVELEIDRAITAKMLAGAAFLNRLRGRIDLSRTFTERALLLARQAGDKEYAARSLYQLAIVSLDDDNADAAEISLKEGLALAEELADQQILGLLCNGFGELARMRGDHSSAFDHYQRSLAYNRKAGDRVRETTSLINLGATALLMGNAEAAGSLYLEGLGISSAMADMNGTHYCLEGVAGTYWAERDAETAAVLYGAAEASRRATNLLIEPADLAIYQQALDSVRRSVADKFDSLFARGSAMKLGDAVALALSKELDEKSVSGKASKGRE